MLKNRRLRMLLAVGITLLVPAVGLWYWLAADLPSVEGLAARGTAPSSRLLDRHGRLLYEIADPELGRHTLLPLSALPRTLISATVATEDANFYTHPGVDVVGILRAAWINTQGGETLAGGSTITQQVARNLLLGAQERNERTLRRKLRESILAWQITQRYSKDEILALYLNETYYGHFAFGVEAAARAYFGKSAADLDLAESALLAGLPQSPGFYDPLSDPEAAQTRQHIVLDLMEKGGMISAEQARLARSEKLQFAAAPFPIHAPHFVTTVWAELEAELGQAELYRGGLTITTTLDLDWQTAAEDAMQRHLFNLNLPGGGGPAHNAHNAALVALDPQTGEVLVLIGSPDYFDPAVSGAVNGALARRQPGSTIKAFTYAAALTPRPGYTPLTAASMLLDVRSVFMTAENEPYVPLNYDYRFHGPVLARVALGSSYNIPAVKVLAHTGVPSMLALSENVGLGLDPGRQYGLAVTLGGSEVRLLDLTAGYGVFASGGKRVVPRLVREIRDAQGTLITLAAHPEHGQQVVDPRVAFLITDILSDDQARAPSFGYNSVLALSRPAAVKTGTTTGFRDNWTVGYTPDLVVGVWVGNADNSALVNASGVTGAGPLWHTVMETLLRGRPEQAFPVPAGLTRATVCTLSGLKPTAYCPYTREEWFLAGTEPTEYDTFYRPYKVDRATGALAGPDTPPERVVERVFVVLPPEAEDWARQEHLPLPPVATSTTAGASDAPLVMTAPDANSTWWLAPSIPTSAQQIRIAARAQAGLTRVTLMRDGVLLATLTAAPYETWWTLMPGTHTFQAVGEMADGTSVTSAPVQITVKAVVP